MKGLGSPAMFVNGWRFLNIGVLVHLWLMSDSGTDSFILILLLLVMTSLRWRFRDRMPLWTVVVDVLLCVVYAPSTEISMYGLALPIFELALKGSWLFALLPFSVLPFLTQSSGFIFWYYLQALGFGLYTFLTIKQQEKYKQEADELRKIRYELERMNIDLLEANVTASQQAELMERYRISRELHDHLGHDLTGASLALQAYEYVQEPEEAAQLLDEIKGRIDRSVRSLRETVHNMTPVTAIGVERLEQIIQHIHQLAIQFRQSGDMRLVPAHKWGLLEACLKEALTNVARHSQATQVEVELRVTESIVRLSIQDNGIGASQAGKPPGSGLRSLQLRSRSMGGSLSISNTDRGFLLVCVIPLDKEETNASVNRR